MVSKKKTLEEIRDINVIDMILIDHRYIKECVEMLKSDKTDKREKLGIASDFIDILQKHSNAEMEVVYNPLEKDEEFHFNILEARIEHDLFLQKSKSLKPRVAHMKNLSDEVEAELKVMAELVEHHLKEEESELFTKMNHELPADLLIEMGRTFMKKRKLTMKDLRDFPHLQDELIQWKDNVQKVSSQFLSKMDKYVENLKH